MRWLTADAFAQLALAFTDPLQHKYEIIRPVVLFAETVAECSRETGVERRQVGTQVADAEIACLRIPPLRHG